MVPNPSRRSILKLGAAVGISGSFAGCSSVLAQEAELRIQNETSEKRAIFVEVSSAVTGESFVDGEFRIPPGGPHMLAKEVFPSAGEYDVCARAEDVPEQCETWHVEEDHPEYHVTLNPATEEKDTHFTMGRFD